MTLTLTFKDGTSMKVIDEYSQHRYVSVLQHVLAGRTEDFLINAQLLYKSFQLYYFNGGFGPVKPCDTNVVSIGRLYLCEPEEIITVGINHAPNPPLLGY